MTPRVRIPAGVAAGPVRTYVRQLQRDGMTIVQIADAAGLARFTIYRLLGKGRPRTRRLRPRTASQLLAVFLPDELAEERKPIRGHISDENEDSFGLPPTFVGDRRALAWKARGNCVTGSYPVRLFFPCRGDVVTLTAARTVCEGCPVRQPCLEYAIATNSVGVWAGTTDLERQQRRGLKAKRGNGCHKSEFSVGA